jgi:protein-tyrosine phosphatase
MNVDPYIGNRVRLRGVAEDGCDYINASPIRLPKQPTSGKEDSLDFIATQGPKDSSTAHFWQMIWDEAGDPAVIVMLTQTEESGREKCFQYFPLDESNAQMTVSDEVPELNSQTEDDDVVAAPEPPTTAFRANIVLKSIRHDPASNSIVRQLEIQSLTEHKTKQVYHFLFTGWPDFLVPEGDDRQALVNLIRQSRSIASPTVTVHDSPRIVHCSAGVGRTGSFIALDYLLEQLDAGAYDHMAAEATAEEMDDPVMELVDHLRQQRMMMVQGEQQFWFLYDMLKERWLARYKARQTSN